MKIMHMNKEFILTNINRLIEIDKLVFDGNSYWTIDNFLMEFKSKWECSLVALEDKNIIGFMICSIKGENLHIHRIAVSPKYQRQGIGTSLMEHLFSNCNKSNIKFITVKTKKNNVNAQRFYERQNFKKMGTDGPNYVYKVEIR